MKPRPAAVLVVCVTILGGAVSAFAISPRALEDAYWRFEDQGTGAADGVIVPRGDDVVADFSSYKNQQHCHADPDPILTQFHPHWSAFVPTGKILRSGASNLLSMRFSMQANGREGNDLWTNAKNINNPVFTDITIEAAFYPDAVAPEGRYQAIIAKNGKPTSMPEPPLVLKIRGDDGTLQFEVIDKAGQLCSVRSLQPLTGGQWYYAAAVGTATSIRLYLDRGDGNGYVLQGEAPVSGGAPMIQYELGAPEDTGWDEAQQKFTLWKMDTSWAIGRGCYNDGNADWFAGWIDEVRISAQALPPDQFLWIDAPPANPADFDGNGKTDIDDLVIFNNCSVASGPEIPYNPRALPANCGQQPKDGKIPPDIDKDGDVDQDDFGIFQRWYTG